MNLGQRDRTPVQPDSDLVVFAAPVFGGRIPSVAAERLNELDGTGKKAVTLVVYGNRAYEDALLELNDIAENRGFQVIALAALVAQHSMAPEVAKGRPDDQDSRSILVFSGKVLDKMESGVESPVKVPGNHPYKDMMHMPATPISLPSCNQCGECESVCLSDRSNQDGRWYGCNKSGKMYFVYGLHCGMSGACPHSSAAFTGKDGADAGSAESCPQRK